ncbi:hypothetical protein Tco_0824986 [Tanacetum coccineum]
MMVFSLLTRTKIDIGEIIYTDLVIRLLETLRKKYVAYHRFILFVLERLLNTDYTQDITLGSTPSVLSKQNFNRNSSKVQPIELTEYMLSVVNHQALVSPTSSLEKVSKKKKSQTVTKHKPKLQCHEASGVPPKAMDTSHSVSSRQSIDPQDTAGNKQPIVNGLPSTQPKDRTRYNTPKLGHSGILSGSVTS